MSFPSKLRAEYAELANQYLDNIPIEKPEEFAVVSEALKVITEPNKPHHVPPSLEDRIKDIKEVLDQPEIYVRDRANDQEFKNIVLQRVAKKIEELDQLGDKEKEKYVAEQKKQKTEAIQNQSTMAEHKPPAAGSEAHTLSDNNINPQEEINRVSTELTQRLGEIKEGDNPMTVEDMLRLQMQMSRLNRLHQITQMP